MNYAEYLDDNLGYWVFKNYLAVINLIKDQVKNVDNDDYDKWNIGKLSPMHSQPSPHLGVSIKLLQTPHLSKNNINLREEIFQFIGLVVTVSPVK